MLVDIRHLQKSYHVGGQAQLVLRDVNLRINPGEAVSIMGRSGSGKSTLMNIMGMLDTPDSGEYDFGGESVSVLSSHQRAHRRNTALGFVFQSFHLLPRLTVWENVALPLLYRDLPLTMRKERALVQLQRVHMQDFAYYPPSKLSGGQQQRVAIARALVGDPQLILADEPTGSLDIEMGKEILDLFLKLNREDGTSILIITHDTAVSERCTRQLSMREGRLEE